jgi:hypothetical protein
MPEPIETGSRTTNSAFRLATWLLGAILLAAVIAVVGRQFLFVEQQETRTLDDLVGQLRNAGLQVVPLEPLSDTAGAQHAARVTVDGAPVELFHYDVNQPDQLKRLREIRAAGKMQRDGKAAPVLVNDAFVMAGSQENPRRELLEREFRGFGDFEGIKEQRKVH